MSQTRTRTKIHNETKVTYKIIFHLNRIDFYIPYGDYISIECKDKTYDEKDESIKLLRVFYKILDMEVKQIEKFLNIKIKDGEITDNNGDKIIDIKI
jgi:hypothetical protein